MSLFRELQFSLLLIMREKGELKTGGKGSDVEWLHEKLGVFSGGDGKRKRFGTEGGDLTQVSSGSLWLQPGEGEQMMMEWGGDGKNRKEATAVLQASVGGCTRVVAVDVGEPVGFWISFLVAAQNFTFYE